MKILVIGSRQCLTSADPQDLAAALTFALRYQGRKRIHNADELPAAANLSRL